MRTTIIARLWNDMHSHFLKLGLSVKKTSKISGTALLFFAGFTQLHAQQNWTGSPAGTAQPYLFTTYSGGYTPKIGIGAFNNGSSPVLPTSDLHIYTPIPTITFQGTNPTSGNSGLAWTGQGGNYTMQTTWYPNAGTGRLHIAGSTGYGVHLSGGNIVFGADAAGPGVSTLGNFTFNGAIGTSSLAVSPATSAGAGSSVFAIPSGNIFGVNGSSYLGGVATIGTAGSTATNLVVNGGSIVNGNSYLSGTSTIGNVGSTLPGLVVNGTTALKGATNITGGWVGIGTTTPAVTLDVHDEGGSIRISNVLGTAPANAGIAISSCNGCYGIEYNNPIILAQRNTKFYFNSGGVYNAAKADLVFTSGFGTVNTNMTILGQTGQVGIGMTPCTSSSGLLQVNGQIEATSLKLELLSGSCFPDYVFAKDYALKPLKDLEKYISEYHHLPNVPSATEVEKTGIDVVDMDIKLLEKIEELTLYVIDLKKENDNLKVQNESFKKDSESIDKKLEALSQQMQTLANNQKK